jgi:hypothetical protein
LSAIFASRLEQVAQSYATNNNFIGTVLVAKGDQLFLSKGYGLANLEWSVPNTPSNRVRDLTPRSQDLPPGSHPFPTRYARRNSNLTFNIAGYSRQLVNDYLVEGGKIEHVELHSPSELSQISQKVVINATGYGARALWNDESIVPVRGQIAWLIPQPEVNYGVQYKNVNILSRRDGIVVQDGGKGEMEVITTPMSSQIAQPRNPRFE